MAAGDHHVTPENDLRGHIWNGDPCPCMPRRRGHIVIHNAYDKREVGEAIRRALGHLGKALANYGHNWSDDDRDSFEHLELLALLHWPEKRNHGGGRGPALDV